MIKDSIKDLYPLFIVGIITCIAIFFTGFFNPFIPKGATFVAVFFSTSLITIIGTKMAIKKWGHSGSYVFLTSIFVKMAIFMILDECGIHLLKNLNVVEKLFIITTLFFHLAIEIYAIRHDLLRINT